MQRLVKGNISDAEDLFDLGESIFFCKKCGCEDCQAQLANAYDSFKHLVELSETWYRIYLENAGIVFRGIYEQWDEKRCAMACRFSGVDA